MQQPGIIITGTLDGHKTLYTFGNFTNEDVSFISSDARSGLGNENDIGKECYAISFAPNGLVFRKYRIVQDSFKRPGYVAISLFVPYESRISGSLIIETLDNLLAKLNLFIPNNRLGEQNIDWHFIEDIFHPISVKIKESYSQPYKTTSSQLLDAAYIFYKPSNLVKFFDDINQKEYYKYRQVLFLDESEKDHENILGLKHSVEITQLIDIENPSYHIVVNPNGGVQVTINGNSNFSQGFKKNENITITFSKPFHEEKPLTGQLGELLEYALKGSNIDDVNKIIEIQPPDLDELIKEIKVRITGYNNPNRKISISTNSGPIKSKEISANQTIRFEGDEIGQEWTISINQNEYKPYLKSFVPSSYDQLIIELVREQEPPVEKSRPESNKLEPKKPRRLIPYILFASMLFMAICSIALFVFSNQIKRYLTDPPKQQTIENKISREISDAIILYAEGMKLMSKQLAFYLDTLNNHDVDTTETVRLKLNAAFSLRKAINSGDTNEIRIVYKKMKLKRAQNKLLELIREHPKEYESIEDLDSKTLTEINTEIDNLIALANRPIEAGSTENKKNNTATTSPKCNSEPCITDQKFYEDLKALQNKQKSKLTSYRDENSDYLTQAQKENLNQIMNNIPKFNKIDKNLSKLDFLKEVNNLSK